MAAELGQLRKACIAIGAVSDEAQVRIRGLRQAITNSRRSDIRKYKEKVLQQSDQAWACKRYAEYWRCVRSLAGAHGSWVPAAQNAMDAEILALREALRLTFSYFDWICGVDDDMLSLLPSLDHDLGT